MPNFTPNYNLKKPFQTDNFNIDDTNGNMDILDTTIKAIDTKIVNINIPVTSVNTKTGNVVLAANDIKMDDNTTLQANVSSLNTFKNSAQQTLNTHNTDITNLKNTVAAMQNSIWIV